MQYLRRFFNHLQHKTDGASLIGLAFLVMILGLLTVVMTKSYDVWRTYSDSAETTNQLNEIEQALANYVSRTGRYPCPASMTTPMGGEGFGEEVGEVSAVAQEDKDRGNTAKNCGGNTDTPPSTFDFAGTWRVDGAGGQKVRTGAVPVRTLGLPATYIADEYGSRYVYAVTEKMTDYKGIPEGVSGGIEIKDAAGNNVSDYIRHIVLSMGPDSYGAYTTEGTLRQPCDPAVLAGENCDFASDAVFVNTVHKSTADNTQKFVHKVSYNSKSGPGCVNNASGIAKDLAFLVDTSGSMEFDGWGCPPGLGSPCSRMDIAAWALRRVVPARLANLQTLELEGRTGLTGFVYDDPGTTKADVAGNLGNIFLDGDADVTSTAFMNDLEDQIQDYCPLGTTPLGAHTEALADLLGGAAGNRPNKVVLLSDGIHNNGTDITDAMNYVRNNYPDTMEVDIIYISGGSGDTLSSAELQQFQNLAHLTGGEFYNAQNYDDLLKYLYESAGTCENLDLPAPADRPACDGDFCTDNPSAPPPGDPVETCTNMMWDYDGWCKPRPGGGYFPQCSNFNFYEMFCKSDPRFDPGPPANCRLSNFDYDINTCAVCQLTFDKCITTVSEGGSDDPYSSCSTPSPDPEEASCFAPCVDGSGFVEFKHDEHAGLLETNLPGSAVIPMHCVNGNWERDGKFGSGFDGVYAQNTNCSGSTNGACGSSVNTCTAGTLNDIADTSDDYLWECVGSEGGSTASCSTPITIKGCNATHPCNGSDIFLSVGAEVFYSCSADYCVTLKCLSDGTVDSTVQTDMCRDSYSISPGFMP